MKMKTGSARLNKNRKSKRHRPKVGVSMPIGKEINLVNLDKSHIHTILPHEEFNSISKETEVRLTLSLPIF